MLGMSRPLPHPAPDDVTVEGILHALSDPVRADLFMRIAQAACAQTCTSVVEASAHQVPKSTLSQHFKALRDAGLIRSERKGVEMHNTSRCDEVDKRFPGLLAAIMAARRAQLMRAGRARKKA